jgi:hypothetical protein
VLHQQLQDSFIEWSKMYARLQEGFSLQEDAIIQK